MGPETADPWPDLPVNSQMRTAGLGPEFPIPLVADALLNSGRRRSRNARRGKVVAPSYKMLPISRNRYFRISWTANLGP